MPIKKRRKTIGTMDDDGSTFTERFTDKRAEQKNDGLRGENSRRSKKKLKSTKRRGGKRRFNEKKQARRAQKPFNC